MSKSILDVSDLIYSRESGWQIEVSNFSLKPKDFIGIIGSNGAGKSTFLRLLAGILHPSSGIINLSDNPINTYNRSEIAKIIGYLPQEHSYQFDYTVYKTVEFGRYPHKSGYSGLSKYDKEVIDECLTLTNLQPFKDRRLSELSGGERKRAFLASILALEPKALLLDEPAASLDLHHQSVFFNLLKDLSKNGIAVAVVTHELNLASLFCSKTIMLENGRVHSTGNPKEIINQDVIQSVYGHELGVFEHPVCKTPIVLPLQSKSSEDAK